MARYTTTINEYINGELLRSGKNEFVNDGNLTIYDYDFQFMKKILHFDDDVYSIVTNKIFKGFSFNDPTIDKKFKQGFVTRFLDREIGRQTIEAFASQVLYVTIAKEDYIYYAFSEMFDKYLQGTSTGENENIGNATGNQNTKANDSSKGNTVSEDSGKHHDEGTTHSETTESRDTTNENSTVSESRSAEATLPQSEINLSVDNDVLTFADNNTISKDKNVNNGTENTNGTSETNGTTQSDGTNSSNGKVDTTNTSESESDTNTVSDTKQNGTFTNKNYDIGLLERGFEIKEVLYKEYDKKCFLQIW